MLHCKAHFFFSSMMTRLALIVASGKTRRTRDCRSGFAGDHHVRRRTPPVLRRPRPRWRSAWRPQRRLVRPYSLHVIVQYRLSVRLVGERDLGQGVGQNARRTFGTRPVGSRPRRSAGLVDATRLAVLLRFDETNIKNQPISSQLRHKRVGVKHRLIE